VNLERMATTNVRVRCHGSGLSSRTILSLAGEWVFDRRRSSDSAPLLLAAASGSFVASTSVENSARTCAVAKSPTTGMVSTRPFSLGRTWKMARHSGHRSRIPAKITSRRVYHRLPWRNFFDARLTLNPICRTMMFNQSAASISMSLGIASPPRGPDDFHQASDSMRLNGTY